MRVAARIERISEDHCVCVCVYVCVCVLCVCVYIIARFQTVFEVGNFK